MSGNSANDNATTGTASDIMQQAEDLNQNVYSNLTDKLGNISTRLKSLIQNNQTPNTELAQDLSALNTSLTDATSSIATIQNQNLGFLQDFKDFAVQNQINQGITNNYSEKQFKDLQAVNEIVNRDNQNKKRMTEINRYYAQKNEAMNGLMQHVLIGMAVILLVIILTKKEILPSEIGQFIGWGIFIYLCAIVAYKMYDISRRDNINFDEYDIPFDPVARQKMADGSLTDITRELGTELSGLAFSKNLFGCVGKDCCAIGTQYDTSLNQCVDKPS